MRHVVHVDDPPQPRYHEEKGTLKHLVLPYQLHRFHVGPFQQVLVDGYVTVPSGGTDYELQREATHLPSHLFRGHFQVVRDIRFFTVDGSGKLDVTPPRRVVLKENENTYEQSRATYGVAYAVDIIARRADFRPLALNVFPHPGHVAVEVVQPRPELKQYDPDASVRQVIARDALGAEDGHENVEETDGVRSYPFRVAYL